MGEEMIIAIAIFLTLVFAYLGYIIEGQQRHIKAAEKCITNMFHDPQNVSTWFIQYQINVSAFNFLKHLTKEQQEERKNKWLSM